ncbi:MAG: hypothetical protein KDA99_09850, partial [Planctomycetales bacterium]|nr:hypothetical protein [Planctomycetales bacterium]
MTTKKDLKKHVRDRQAKTGESYSTARQYVLRGKESRHVGESIFPKRITAIVLGCSDRSIRLRPLDGTDVISLRTGGLTAYCVAPGQLVNVELSKRWTWSGFDHCAGRIERVWTDVAALGLDPLPLEDRGEYDLNAAHEPFEATDPYASMWHRSASRLRRAFAFSGIAWGVGVGVDSADGEACLVADAAEMQDSGAARKLLMKALAADLRCVDAHAHLGNLAFHYRPEYAITHYDIAIRIAELSLPPDFKELLPWGFIFNRPFLRALHGYGLCL